MSDNDLFLSKIVVHMSNHRESYITDISSNHRFIYSMFDRIDKGRLLWVNNSSLRQKSFLVVSEVKPLLKDKFRSFVTLDCKQINDHFFEHTEYAFKSLVNCCVCRQGKRVPLFDTVEIAAWLKQKFAQADCLLCEENLSVSPSTALIFNHLSSHPCCNKEPGSAQRITINVCQISGVFRANNPLLLKNLVRTGIGRSKTFGCGLLQLIPLSNI